MHGTVNTRLASGVVVLVWALSVAALTALRAFTVQEAAIFALLAVAAYIVYPPIPAAELPWRKTGIAFGLPLALCVAAVVLRLYGSRGDAWIIGAATYIAAGRLKDALGDRRVYLPFP